MRFDPLAHSVYLIVLVLAIYPPAWYIRAVAVLLLPLLCVVHSVRSLGARKQAQSSEASPSSPTFVLHSLAASHFVEKVRWCLDHVGGGRAACLYREEKDIGILGIFLTARTVPTLSHAAGGASVGNSSNILRYLYAYFKACVPADVAASIVGEHGHTDGDGEGGSAGAAGTSSDAIGRSIARLATHGIGAEQRERALELLEPTPERVHWEGELDRLGEAIQMWGYGTFLHITPIVQRLWGCYLEEVPWWQRYIMLAGAPVFQFLLRRALQGGITELRVQRAERYILSMVDRMDALLSAQEQKKKKLGASCGAAPTHLVGDSFSYVDIWWAANMGLLLGVPGYADGNANGCTIQFDTAALRGAEKQVWEQLPAHAREVREALLSRPSVRYAFSLYADRRHEFTTYA